MAIESLLTISRDENERARLLTQEKNLVDWQAGINYARREGRQEERQEIKDEAQNMLKQGMTAEQVLNRLLGK